MRKEPLVTDEVYHVFNKSIAEFKIYNNNSEFSRMINVICYYQRCSPAIKFSSLIRSDEIKQNVSEGKILFSAINSHEDKFVEIIAYCIMPTHIHLILKQLKEDGISEFMRIILDSYARYFNIKHKRKGPLWEGRFKNVHVKNDEQLLHLTRYTHLNPVTAYLVNRPEDWHASSYKEYILAGKIDSHDRICKYDDILDINPALYREFVEDRISYQRELAKIKDILIE